jgi:hypothetical protein
MNFIKLIIAFLVSSLGVKPCEYRGWRKNESLRQCWSMP